MFYKKRTNKPSHLLGKTFVFKGSPYLVESLELQEQQWMAMVIRLTDARKNSAECWAVSATALVLL